MLLRSGTQVEALKDIETILIPDGTVASIKQGSMVFIQQILGGMFTVQTEEGHLMRIDGRDAEAIGQKVPDDRRLVSEEEVSQKGVNTVVTEQLKTCYDPEIPVNIVDLGLVYETEIKPCDDNDKEYLVRVEMTLTAPGCGMGEILKSDVEKKLSGIPGVRSVLVDLVFDPPWESSLMSEAAKLQLGFM